MIRSVSSFRLSTGGLWVRSYLRSHSFLGLAGNCRTARGVKSWSHNLLDRRGICCLDEIHTSWEESVFKAGAEFPHLERLPVTQEAAVRLPLLLRQYLSVQRSGPLWLHVLVILELEVDCAKFAPMAATKPSAARP